jgi:hypothetical protein
MSHFEYNKCAATHVRLTAITYCSATLSRIALNTWSEVTESATRQEILFLGTSRTGHAEGWRVI